MKVFLFIAAAACAYLLGGANGAIIVSKLLFKKDIRNYGSGNAGLTNFYRTFGKKGAVFVILADVLKTVIAMLLSRFVLGGYCSLRFAKLYGGIFAMLGHVFPAYYGFKGGKSVLCGGTMTLVLGWKFALPCWGAFAVGFVCTKYVSVGSIAAGAAFALAMALMHPTWYEMLFALVGSALLIGRHAGNISRLIQGKESKFSFNKKGR